MALVLNDRVKETTTTTGTGTINLGGAATGFETFVAGIGNSNTTYYCIAGQGTAEFEVGIGTVTDASPDTLSRTTILSSSNNDSAVNFSAGTKDVFCTLPASKTIREVDTALNVPTGTTAQRAGSPAAGDLRFNTTTSKFEGYSGSAWGDIGVGNFLVTNTFTGDGSDTTFTISNAVADENNLLVFIDGVFQAQNVYSISGTTLTFATAPANGRVITVYSALNNIQGANVVKATMTGDNSDTTLALGVTPISENAVQVYFDGVYQNKDSFSISGETLTFGVAPPTGVAVEAITLTVTDLAAAASSILVDEFTGDGSDTTFTLSAAPANENNTQVFVGGVYQEKATYSISGTTLTFSEAPANTVSIEVVSVAVGQINSAIQLSDADGDTKVMVEESADEDKIRFDTAGTERMIITNAGKVGVSTSDPSQLLTVQSATFPVIEVANYSDSNPTDGAALDLIEKQPSYASATNTFGQTGVYGYRIKLNGSDNTLRIKSGSQTTVNDRVVIDRDTNNIGLGTTSLTKDTGYATLSLSDTTGGQVVFKENGTTMAGLNGNSTRLSLAAVGSRNIIFSTNGSERMRITGTGNFLLGTTDTSYSSGPGFKFTPSATNPIYGMVVNTSTGNASNFHFYNTNASFSGFRWYIHANGGTVNYAGNNVNLSDEKVKTNIELSGNYLEKICNIPVKVFNYKDEPEDEDRSLGVIAQDVEAVAPELVSNDGFGDTPEDGVPLKTVYTTDMMYALMKAIQEQQVIIEQLKDKIE